MFQKIAICCSLLLFIGCSSSESESQSKEITSSISGSSSFHTHVSHGKGNTPVSLVKSDSLYHLFYTTGADEWGQLTSKNLIDWTSFHSVPLEGNGSGSIVWDENNTTGLSGKLIAIQKNEDELNLSYSSDGINWQEFIDNPIVTASGNNPSISWSKQLDSWLLTLTQDKSAKVFKSNDLINWEELSEISLEPNNVTKTSLFQSADEFVFMAFGEVIGYQSAFFDGTNFIPKSDLTPINISNPSIGILLHQDDHSTMILAGIESTMFSIPTSLTWTKDFSIAPEEESFKAIATSKRRGKISKLIPEGPCRFQFNITDQINESMRIEVLGQNSKLTFKWTKSDGTLEILKESGGTKEVIQSQSLALLEGKVSVDLLIDQTYTDLFLGNNSLFPYIKFNSAGTLTVSVYVDDKYYDANGVLFDIGL